MGARDFCFPGYRPLGKLGMWLDKGITRGQSDNRFNNRIQDKMGLTTGMHYLSILSLITSEELYNLYGLYGEMPSIQNFIIHAS